jgi:hypothetical protein
MPFLFEASHTYIFVALIEQFGVFESALILTGVVYLIGFPFYLGFKGILPSKSKEFLLIYCFTSSAIGTLPFWAAPGLGILYDAILTIPIIILPFGAYLLLIFFDKTGIISSVRKSPSIIQVVVVILVLFIIPVSAVIDWIFYKGHYILARTGEYSVLLTLFGLSALGSFTCLFLLMPIVGLVSFLSATIRWLSKDKSIKSEPSLNKESESSRYNMKLQDCGCGGTPHVTMNIDDKNLFIVSCPVCGSSTLGYDTLRNAQLIWNTWCCKQGCRFPENATA